MESFNKALELSSFERSCTQSLPSELTTGEKFGRCQRERNLVSASVQDSLQHRKMQGGVLLLSVVVLTE